MGAGDIHLGEIHGDDEDFLLLDVALARIWPEVPATKLWPQNSMRSPAARSSSNLRVVRASEIIA